MKVIKGAKSAMIEVTVTRADGSVEHYGRVCYYHRNFIKRWFWNSVIWLRRKYGNGSN